MGMSDEGEHHEYTVVGIHLVEEPNIIHLFKSKVGLGLKIAKDGHELSNRVLSFNDRKINDMVDHYCYN